MPYLSPALNVMTTAARKASRKLIRDFGEVENLQISVKGPGDFVTVADQRTESILIGELQRARGGYPILSEEVGLIDGPDKSHRFIIDPLDGTTNFLHGIPHFAISIALERDGQLVSGVIYNPITDDMFTAEKGHGAYLNDMRLRVAGRKDVRTALCATGIPWMGKDGHERFQAELGTVMKTTSGVRRFGSAALDLAWLAAGRYDMYWERDLNNQQKMLETGHVIASNEAMHGQFLKMLKDAGKS